MVHQQSQTSQRMQAVATTEVRTLLLCRVPAGHSFTVATVISKIRIFECNHLMERAGVGRDAHCRKLEDRTAAGHGIGTPASAVARKDLQARGSFGSVKNAWGEAQVLWAIKRKRTSPPQGFPGSGAGEALTATSAGQLRSSGLVRQGSLHNIKTPA